MKCDSCGRQNRENAKYCAGCGKELTAPAQKKKPDKTAKNKKPKSRRLLYLVLISMFLLISDVFVLSVFPYWFIYDESITYDFDEFSISMAAGFTPKPVRELHLSRGCYYANQPIKRYAYTNDEGEVFTACIAKEFSSEDLSCAKENVGSFSADVISTLYYPKDWALPFNPDTEDERYKYTYEDQFVFINYTCFQIKGYDYDNGGGYLFLCREIIKDGCIYSFCIRHRSDDFKSAQAWLETIEMKSDG